MEAFSYRFPEMSQAEVIKRLENQRTKELDFFNQKPPRDTSSLKKPLHMNSITGFTFMLRQILKSSSHRSNKAMKPKEVKVKQPTGFTQTYEVSREESRKFKRMTQIAKIIDTVEDRANESRHSTEHARNNARVITAEERQKFEQYLLRSIAGAPEDENTPKAVTAKPLIQAQPKLNKQDVVEEAPQAEEASDEQFAD